MPNLEVLNENVHKAALEENSPEHLPIMGHVLQHLLPQVKANGPMREMWMFVFEDYFGVLKRKIKTRSNPVASIMKAIELRAMIDMVKGLQELSLHGTPNIPYSPNDSSRYVCLHTELGDMKPGQRVQLTDDDMRMFRIWLREHYPDYMALYERFLKALNNYTRYVCVLI